MNPRDFIYWLQGFLEVANPETITKEQVEMIKRHLSLAFIKVTETDNPPIIIPNTPYPPPLSPWGSKDYDEIYKTTMFCATNVPPICADPGTSC